MFKNNSTTHSALSLEEGAGSTSSAGGIWQFFSKLSAKAKELIKRAPSEDVVASDDEFAPDRDGPSDEAPAPRSYKGPRCRPVPPAAENAPPLRPMNYDGSDFTDARPAATEAQMFGAAGALNPATTPWPNLPPMVFLVVLFLKAFLEIFLVVLDSMRESNRATVLLLPESARADAMADMPFTFNPPPMESVQLLRRIAVRRANQQPDLEANQGGIDTD